MSNERDIPGIWIPIEIWEDPKLTPFEKMLLGEINSLDCGEGCFKSDANLAKRMTCSISHISNTIASLKTRKYLKTIGKNSRKRWLRTSFSRFLVKNRPTFYSRSDLLSTVGHHHTTYDQEITVSNVARSRRATSGGILGSNDSPKNKDAVRLTKLYHEFLIKNNLHKGRADLPSGNSEMSIKKRRSTLSKWIKYCSELLERYDGDADLIERTIIWYFKNIGDSYLGTYLSMKTFGDCENFEKIQKAMRREKESKGSKLSKYRFKINGKPVEEDED